MLTAIEVHNFQSLKDIKLELGNFTVILGDSNCGKSALIRALEALSSNVRGTSFVTVGEKVATVSAWSESYKITFKKSESGSSYSFCDFLGSEKEYTKLASGVPKEISDSLRIDPLESGNSINFASQHDSPFLLKDSGASVARILGELTNVDTLFEAVREANRRRSGANSTLKVRQEDLKSSKIQIQQLGDLKVLKSQLAELETVDADIKHLVNQINKLTDIVSTLDSLAAAIKKQKICDIPDADTLQNNYTVLSSYQQELIDLSDLKASLKNHIKASENVASRLRVAKVEWAQLLKEAGNCPTCGQEVSS